jgi:hypothetical protein
LRFMNLLRGYYFLLTISFTPLLNIIGIFYNCAKSSGILKPRTLVVSTLVIYLFMNLLTTSE